MTDEHVEREAARPGASSGGHLLSILEFVHRLHASVDEAGLLAAAAAAFSALMGSAPSVVRITHDGPVSRRLASDTFGESIDVLMERATAEGVAVVDHDPPRGVAFPIRSADRSKGAVYVAHADSNMTKVATFELLKLVAAHVGVASINLQQRCAPAPSPFAADNVPGSMSLRDAKFEFERRLLQVRLDEVRGNVAAAARSLDMDRGQLSRLMKKHHLDRASFRPLKAQE